MTDLIDCLHRRREQSVYWLTVLLQAPSPSHFGSYIILGHPSAGTNWLCNLLSNYLDTPVFEWNRNMPSLESQIFHLHRFVGGALQRNRTIYMYRDGRDTLVSLFMKVAKTPWMGGWRDKFHKDTGVILDANLIDEQLPTYIEWHFTKRSPASVNWREHILRGLRDGYKTISFEELKQNPSSSLRAVLCDLGHSQIDEKKLEIAIGMNDIENIKTEENSYQVRNGRPAQWRQYFTIESAKLFQKYAGEELIMLGYETDASWVDTISFKLPV